MRLMLQRPYRRDSVFRSPFFDSAFDGLFSLENHPHFRSQQSLQNIEETEEHFLLTIDLPGVKKNDLKIETTGDGLSIRALRGERQYQKNFRLPESVRSESIEAHYEDGVLTVLLPKVEAVKPRTVEIQSDSEGFFQRLLPKVKKSS